VNPRYVISVGNQSDLTTADYLTYLADDADVAVFACYIEGFKAGDGQRWLEAARRITAGGRQVVAYRAGRTAVGARATASHTAAVAGEYAVFRALAEQAGVLVAETLADFEALLQLAVRLHGRRVAGTRLGAVSNAGFECVAIADSLGGFRLAEFGAATGDALEALLRRHRLDDVVPVTNPLDLTPIMDDAGYAAAVQAVLADDGVDVAVVGCVPLTGALQTLDAGPGHDEDLHDPASLASRLAQLADAQPKAWVAVVDGGPQYDPFAARLLRAGIPTFRSADRAVRLLDRYCRSRLSASPTGQ
jgi:acyl-CoA synthetase (NDP forming)